MNNKHQSYVAFMESVCNKFNCPEAIPALKEGFKAFCEAAYNSVRMDQDTRTVYFGDDNQGERFPASSYMQARHKLRNEGNAEPTAEELRNEVLNICGAPLSQEEVDSRRGMVVQSRAEDDQRIQEQARRSKLLIDHQGEFENACDDLYYGYGFNFWYNDSMKEYLSEDDARIIWNAAKAKMSRDD